MGYLSFWQALTYKNARPKKITVNSSIVTSCIASLDSMSGFGEAACSRMILALALFDSPKEFVN
jgi:hypothetical protein